ncbi:MAG: hypothetical protein CL834_07965 [Crocinitomicaceae bacterium]|nr:hypothetical protein [Crocinitomicaceae bacterium]
MMPKKVTGLEASNIFAIATGLILGLMTVSSMNSCQLERDKAVTTSVVHINATAQNQDLQKNRPMPAITFQDTLINLGIMAEGNVKEVTFPFLNTGKAPLVLADVSTSCGCTIANDWPKKAIAPGKGSEISVRFNSQGRTGENRKEIFVVSNAALSTVTLVLTADVIGPNR